MLMTYIKHFGWEDSIWIMGLDYGSKDGHGVAMSVPAWNHGTAGSRRSGGRTRIKLRKNLIRGLKELISGV